MNLLLKATVVTIVLMAAEAPARAQDVPVGTGAPAYSAVQLEQLLAPIALYPDQLLGPILMGSTYPLEIVEADRWLQNAANASLQGAQLVEALQQEPWDPSIKALVPFPQVLDLLDTNLDWTEQLGSAFLSQQADVMDAVQRLRVRAQSAGTLQSSEREAVQTLGQAVEIAPADPDIVYVPVYDPLSAYGDWPSAQYPPDDFIVTGYPFGSFIGTPIVPALWGWNQWDWGGHRLNIVGRPGPDRPPVHPAPWRHDPAHHGPAPAPGPSWAPRSVRSPIPAPGVHAMASAPAMVPVAAMPAVRRAPAEPAVAEAGAVPTVRRVPAVPTAGAVPAVRTVEVRESLPLAAPAFVLRPEPARTVPARAAAPVVESFRRAAPAPGPAQPAADSPAPELRTGSRRY